MILDPNILGIRANKWLPFIGGMIFIFISVVLLNLYILPPLMGLTGINLTQDLDIESPNVLFLVLLSVAFAIPPISLWLKFVHKRSLISLISPFGAGMINALKIAGIFFAIYFFLGEVIVSLIPTLHISVEYIWQPKLWLFWVLPIAIVTFLQTSAEEFVFRGYFQQYLAALIPIKWVYYLVPTLVWMSLHFGNIEGYYSNLAALFSVFVMGIIFADWVDISKSLWGPMIVHFLNNFILLCVYGNTLEKSDLHIIRANYDALSDPTIALLTFLGSCLMAITYYFLRPKITAPLF